MTLLGERAAPSAPLRRRVDAARAAGLLQCAAGHGVQPLLGAVDVVAVLLAQAMVGVSPIALLGLLGMVIVLFATAGLYRSRLTLSVLDDLPVLLSRTLAAGSGVAAVLLLLERPGARDVALTAVALAIGVVALRAGAYHLVRQFRASGAVRHPTLVLGAGRVGGHVADLLMEHPAFGLRPVGFLDRDPLLLPQDLPVPLLGGLDRLAEVIADRHVRSVIVAFTGDRESDLVDVIRTCDRMRCEIFFVPRLYELHTTSRDMDQLRGLPLVRLRRAAFRSPAWRVNRLADVLVASTLVLLLGPLMLACALAVRLSTAPTILFRQDRVGLDGRQFAVLKFCTMAPAGPEEAAVVWNIRGDARIGRVGRVMRSTSLDELPQLLNVLKGEMSLVGPRPERPHFVSEFTERFPRYPARHRVPSGLTGWAQVNGLRGDTSIVDRARFDNYYVENWSLYLDLKIMLRTVLAVARREGG